MLGSHMKKNTAPPPAETNDNQQSMIPKELPPLRTFVLRQLNPNGDGTVVEREVVAHGLMIDEARMISFVVFFYLDPLTRLQAAQALKLVLNSDAWLEIEEINPMFPELMTH